MDKRLSRTGQENYDLRARVQNFKGARRYSQQCLTSYGTGFEELAIAQHILRRESFRLRAEIHRVYECGDKAEFERRKSYQKRMEEFL